MVPYLTLSSAKDLSDIAQAVVTTAAVVVGGFWAYYKFVRGRLYSPHVDIALFGQWRTYEARPLLPDETRRPPFFKSASS